MAEIGYTLSCEEHRPDALVRLAADAEEAGFTFATISDHFHPWTDAQGQSPFVWAVIGGVAQVTQRLRLGTAVTCPSKRVHPALVAQAAATAEAMMPGRFFLGVGSGENLNEHIVGGFWPPAGVRLEMLEEAVTMIRRLWEGGVVTYEGRHHQVYNARIYTLPERPPPIMVAAAGSKSAELAGRAGDGLVSVAPKAETVETFRAAGGDGKPCYGQVHVCWAEDEAKARRTAHEQWPNAAIPGELGQELPMPAHFEQASSAVTEDQVADSVTCGPDPERHIAAIRKYLDAGFDHVVVHQIGPDQEGFFRFYRSEVLPKFS
jgi:coenzyme F420-dependent glucose-6-phosphate dehydrogenase